MTAIQQSTGDFGFGAEDVHLLASMKYWALRAEALKSSSYSRVRKHFMNDEVKEREQQAYREKKQSWADQWYSLTSKETLDNKTRRPPNRVNLFAPNYFA